MQRDASSVDMRYVFADGEQGFPETLALEQPTVVSFATHVFSNLNGAASGSALNHEVMIAADRYFGMTPDLIATGQLLPVDSTPFDLRQPTVLSR